MYAFEITYREDGLYKARGFKYRDQFERFVARMLKKANVEIIEVFLNWEGKTIKGEDLK